MRKQVRRRAFSLIELVIVLFLTGVCLFMVGQLTNRTFRTLRFLQEKSQTLQSAALGLERLTSELREAVEVSDTDPLVFDKVDPAAPFALDYDENSSPDSNPGDPPPTFPPANLSDGYESDAGNRNQLGTVTYRVDNEILSRTATRKNNSLTSEVATAVNDFTVVRGPQIDGVTTGDSVFRVSLSLREDRRVVKFESMVLVPGLDR